MLSNLALSRIQEEIALFRKKQHKDCFTPDYALGRKLGVPSSDEMYISCDCSLLNNGGCGYIITNRGVYGKKWGGFSKHYFSFERLASASIYVFAPSHIEADGELVAYCDSDYGDDTLLCDLLEHIAAIARQDMGI